MSEETISMHAREIRRLQTEKAQLLAALKELVQTEEEYGDEANVAVGQAWLKAKDVINRMESCARQA